MDLVSSLVSSLRTVEPEVLDQEFSMMRSKTATLKRDLTSEVGALKENIKKNRYKDILPYDQSRVVLSLLTSDSDSDYINASIIKGATSHCRYIACQAPLNATLTDFWRMIWQHDVKVIVMACREFEMGKKKCECYWSPVHQSAAFGPFTVHNQGETRPDEDSVVRELTVSYQQVVRSLTQFQFLSWPDHDVPYTAAGVLDLLDRARDRQGTHTAPLLVHCSAGCGRTGVVCALDYIHDLLVTEVISADFSIMDIVLQLRKQRPSAVQTKEQYQFIFSAAATMFERNLQTRGRRRHGNQNQVKKTRSADSISNRLSAMSDTYAVVNKPKPLPPPTDSAYSTVATPTPSRTPPSSCHYDNEPPAPVYSAVRPRGKPHSATPPATPIYDLAANHRPASLSRDYHLVAAASPPAAADDDDYEEFSSSDLNPGSPAGLGFNCRVQKPRGPRDPPADWTRLERLTGL